MNREQELDALIREQERDDTSIVRPEPHVTTSLDVWRDGQPPHERTDPCPIHGMGDMRRWGGRDRCGACDREKHARYRRRKGIRERGGCYRHGYDEWRVPPSGKGYCLVEARWRQRVERRRKRDARNSG